MESPTDFIQQIPEAFRNETLSYMLRGSEGMSAELVVNTLTVKARVIAEMAALSEGDSVVDVLRKSAKDLREVLKDTPDDLRDFLMAMVFADFIQSRSLVSKAVSDVVGKPKKSRTPRKPNLVEEAEFTESMKRAFAQALRALSLDESASYSTIIAESKANGLNEVAFLFIAALMDTDNKMTMKEFSEYSAGPFVRKFRDALRWRFKDEKSPNNKTASGALQANFSRAKGAYLGEKYGAEANLAKAWTLLTT